MQAPLHARLVLHLSAQDKCTRLFGRIDRLCRRWSKCLGRQQNQVQPVETLREDCGVNRDGSKALNIIKAARKHNMEASGYKVEEVSEFLDFEFPLIIHWNFWYHKNYKRSRILNIQFLKKKNHYEKGILCFLVKF